MNKNDAFKENTLGTKIARYGKVSGTMAGLATKIAGEKLTAKAKAAGQAYQDASGSWNK